MTRSETADDDAESVRIRVGPPEPAVVAVFCGGRPTLEARRLRRTSLVIGRETSNGLTLPDERISREHVRVAREGERWVIEDLASHNGTFVDGTRITGKITSAAAHVLRIGQTVVLLETDVRRFDQPHRLDDAALVEGPDLRAAFEAIATAAKSGDHLLVTGESGTGKEHAARLFHTRGLGAKGPFVDVNCAAIPEAIAERLLFGAKKGAFSGATADAAGYVQSAHGGVLFLDEVGELDLEVQAKLLRVLETREVMALGASAPRAVDVRICAATNRDLRAAVAAGKFRADLYYRLAQHTIVLPPLRERPEEIPFLAGLAIARVDSSMKASAKLIEACFLRPWPGNARELLTEVRRAAQATANAGARTVGVESLSPLAGTELTETAPAPSIAAHAASAVASGDDPMRETLLASLRQHDGNVAGVARALGLHRTQLYRLMKKLGIETT
jgi:transcriptional regulator with GAF, ATPase, and Fis domain